MSTLFVKELFIHPLKSGRSISVPEIHLNRMGIVNDRRYMLVDDDGQFLTQRQQFKMALINVSIGSPDNPFFDTDETGSNVDSEEADLVKFTASGMDQLLVNRPAYNASSLCKVQIWNDGCDAVDCGELASKWFTDYLKTPVRLVYMPDEFQRLVDPSFAKNRQTLGFADGFPLMMVGQGSLDDLNSRLPSKQGTLGINRFRPNLLLGGSEPFAEDTWSGIKISGNEKTLGFDIVKPCSRCLIPGINPESGQYEPEVLKVLASYRTKQGAIYFGQNLLGPDNGIIRVGDRVETCEINQ